jgi:hypothetical protein
LGVSCSVLFACGPQYPSATTQTVGPSGGRIVSTDPRLAGTALVIPMGALSSDITFTVAPGPSAAAADQLALGEAVAWTPNAVSFGAAAKMTLPYDPSIPVSSRSIAVVTASDMRYEIGSDDVVIDPNTKTVSFSVEHLGVFQVVGKK